MIKRFHEVIEKRGIMRAKTFLAGSSRLSLAQTTVVSSSEEEDHVSYEVISELISAWNLRILLISERSHAHNAMSMVYVNLRK